jgi:F0F1-type ATP synthase, delta subunit (mitochondrial oligomycin sensitivity protein)
MRIRNESIASIKRQILNYSTEPGNQEVGGKQVTITTARELSDSEFSAIVANLSRKLGENLFVEKFVDPSIVGGIIVQIGDNVFDGSITRQFKQYRDMMSSIDVKEIGVTDAV